MGGHTAPATCTEAANLSLLAAFSIPDGPTAQVQQSQYYLIRIQYPNRTLLYIIRRSVDGTACVVDTNDMCVATVSVLPDDFDVSDLPGDMPPRIPAGRDASEPPVTTDTAPDAVANPYPTNQATAVTVDAPLLSWAASPRATSYDLYWGVTKDLAADADLGTPINTSDTAVSIPRPDATAAERRLAGDTTYYWRVDAKNDAGAARGNVWSFTTGAAPPNVTGIYEGNTTWVWTRTAEGNVVREEAVTRDSFNVWQFTEEIGAANTVLEVLPGSDSLLRDRLLTTVGRKYVTYAFRCALAPDGTCRLCAPSSSAFSDSSICDRVIGTSAITFSVASLSHRNENALYGPTRTGENALSMAGTYRKVADDPGPWPTGEVSPAPAPQPEPAPEPAPGAEPSSPTPLPTPQAEKRWTIEAANFRDDGGAIWLETSNRSEPYSWDSITADNVNDVRVSIGGKELPFTSSAYRPAFASDYSGAEWMVTAQVRAGSVVLVVTAEDQYDERTRSGNSQVVNLYWARQTLYGKQLLVQIFGE